jgi:hypothetical protein
MKLGEGLMVSYFSKEPMELDSFFVSVIKNIIKHIDILVANLILIVIFIVILVLELIVVWLL